jgi:hypothetical protein
MHKDGPHTHTLSLSPHPRFSFDRRQGIYSSRLNLARDLLKVIHLGAITLKYSKASSELPTLGFNIVASRFNALATRIDIVRPKIDAARGASP